MEILVLVSVFVDENV